MAQDILFLLEPHFAHPEAGPSAFYCPECTTLEGVLVYHPELRRKIDVRHVGFQRPRKAILELLGEDLQSAPVLVVGDGEKKEAPGIETSPATKRRYVSGFKAIAEYLASVYGVDRLHP